MNSIEYKELCSKENAFRISDLEETLIVLRRDGAKEASVVASLLLNSRVEKPEKYTGTSVDNFCLVNCTIEEADAIVDILSDAEAGSVTSTDETTAVTSRLVDLVNMWSSFRETL